VRRLRLLTFSVSLLALLVSVLLLAQSNPAPLVNEPNEILPRPLPFGPSRSTGFKASAPRSNPQSGSNFAPAVTYASGGYGAASVAVADVNGDGKPDLIVANACLSNGHGCTGTDGVIGVLLGNGDGTFQPPLTYDSGPLGAQVVAVNDLNGDGFPDLIVSNGCYGTNNCSDSVSILLGNGDGTFKTPVVYSSGGYQPYSVAVADVNGDGKPDVLVVNICADNTCGTDGTVGVLLGNGDGTFEPAVAYDSGGATPLSVTVADVNGDGKPDLVVAYQGCFNCQTNPNVGVLLGNGDGTFQPSVAYATAGYFATSVAVADVNGDGKPDLLVVNECSEYTCKKPGSVGVLLGNGDGTFQTAVAYGSGGAFPFLVAVADVNGDGKPDLLVANFCADNACATKGLVGVLLGNGDGTFQSAVTYATGGYKTYWMAVADVNGDGKPDLLATNFCADSKCATHGTVAVLLNKISQAKTATRVVSSPNPSRVHEAVTITATVASNPIVPDGEVVTFHSGKINLGTAKTTNGVATLTTSFSKAKTYTIKASYPGDAFHRASSGTGKQVVNP